MSKNVNLGLMVSSVIFAIFGLIHLFRLFSHLSVSIGGCEIPVAGSAIAAAVFLFLAFWLWTLRKQ